MAAAPTPPSRTVHLRTWFIGSFAVAGLAGTWQLLNEGRPAAAVAVLAGLTGTALGNLGGAPRHDRNPEPETPASTQGGAPAVTQGPLVASSPTPAEHRFVPGGLVPGLVEDLGAAPVVPAAELPKVDLSEASLAEWLARATGEGNPPVDLLAGDDDDQLGH